MGKVLKIAAAVAGVAAVVASAGSLLAFGTVVGASLFGVGVGTLSLIATGLSIASSILAPKPKSPKASRENIDRLNASIDPRAFRKFCFGTTALATDIRDQEYTDTQTHLHRFIVVASHKIQAIDEIWFDDEKAWSLAGGVTTKFNSYLTVAPILEGSAANAINISARMGSTRRFTGLAYVHLRYKLTGNSKKTESPFAQSIPSRITIRGKGAFIYDPRLDSTVAGGSGTQRANDQTTWAWSDSASRNPALQLLWWLLGWKINGLLVVGKGIPPNRVDLASFAVAANLCDEPVTLAVGGTEPRYRADGVFSEGDGTSTVLESLRACMNADLDDVDGKLRLTVFHNDLAIPVATFTDDDFIDSFNWQQTPSLDESFNIVRGSFTDPSDNALYQQVEYPQVSVASPDNIDRVDIFDVPMVQSPAQAQRLAKQRLQRQIYGGTLSTAFNARGWKVQKNDVVAITLSRLGWTNKLFRIAEMEHRVDGVCPVVLREENAAIYAWDANESPAVIPIAPTVYNFALAAVNQDIAASLVEIVSPPNQTIAADYAGVVLAGQFPRVLKPSVSSAGVNIRIDNGTTYSITSAGVTATINNTAASVEKGWITVTAGGSGYVDLTVTIGGINFGPFRIVFNKVNGAAPTGGASGSSGTRTTFNTITTTAFVELFNPVAPIAVTVGAGQTVTMTAPLEYNITAPNAASASLVAKWQRSPAGAGTWTDITPTTTGSASSWSNSQFSGEPGSGNFNASDSPAAASYDYRMLAALNTAIGTPSLNMFSGTATVTVT